MSLYKIAGLVVSMDVKYERLKKQARPYLYTGTKKPDISLSIQENVMEKARKTYPNINDEGLEYLLYGFLFYDRLLDFDGMMLHASAVAVGDRAYLFSADSGVGKSTHTDYWTKLIKGARIINDDKPALRITDGKIYVWGTPFSGKHDISVNRDYLLGGICFLKRGKENIINDISPQRALPLILPQTASMHSEDRISKKLTLIDRILTGAKLYEMECINDISAARYAYDKMNISFNISLEEMLPAMEETLNSGGKVTFVTKGRSMAPLLVSGRDSVVIGRFDEYKKGDVVLFRNNEGEFILHRIYKIKNDLYYTEGDSLLISDPPIKKEQILGKAVSFIRNAKEIKTSSFSYNIYKWIYMSFIGKKLRLMKRKFKK
ncbi:MAG: S24 family peptidase [Acutalibacteraceae bacterium]|nr:S24 family peptidase [Acutalibacteraceae bacterium]